MSRAASTGWPTDCSGAVVVVVVGSLVGEALTIYGVVPVGVAALDQQWEYLDLPRLWQILLIVGMFLWIAIIYPRDALTAARRVQAEHAVAVLLRRPGDSDVLRGRLARRAATPI